MTTVQIAGLWAGGDPSVVQVAGIWSDVPAAATTVQIAGIWSDPTPLTVDTGGGDRNVEPGTTVTLDGSGSSANGTWAQTGGPSVGTLGGTGLIRTASIPFSAMPAVGAAPAMTDYEFTLSIFNGVNSASQAITLSAYPSQFGIVVNNSGLVLVPRILHVAVP